VASCSDWPYVRDWLLRVLKIPLIIFWGRGFTWYPLASQQTVVFGAPIPVGASAEDPDEAAVAAGPGRYRSPRCPHAFGTLHFLFTKHPMTWRVRSARHIIYTHFAPSFLESHPMTWIWRLSSTRFPHALCILVS